MTEADQYGDQGDYGYDLVHEEVRRPPQPAAPGGTSPPPPDEERADDLNYDEAHDF